MSGPEDSNFEFEKQQLLKNPISMHTVSQLEKKLKKTEKGPRKETQAEKLNRDLKIWPGLDKFIAENRDDDEFDELGEALRPLEVEKGYRPPVF